MKQRKGTDKFKETEKLRNLFKKRNGCTWENSKAVKELKLAQLSKLIHRAMVE